MTEEVPADETLLAKFRQTGDQDLLEPLLRRHLPRVRSMIGQMTLNDYDADDLTQEVFLRAIRGLSQFNARARFSTWLYRIAMNVSRSYLERRGRTLPGGNGEYLERTAVPHEGPLQQAVQHELEAAVEDALGALSAKLRAAIVLNSPAWGKPPALCRAELPTFKFKPVIEDVPTGYIAFLGDDVHLIGRQWWAGKLEGGRLECLADTVPWWYSWGGQIPGRPPDPPLTDELPEIRRVFPSAHYGLLVQRAWSKLHAETTFEARALLAGAKQ